MNAWIYFRFSSTQIPDINYTQEVCFGDFGYFFFEQFCGFESEESANQLTDVPATGTHPPSTGSEEITLFCVNTFFGLCCVLKRSQCFRENSRSNMVWSFAA